MRICFASLYDPEWVASPSEKLQLAPLLRLLPGALASRGHRIDVIHSARRNRFVRIDGVAHHFVPATRGIAAAGAFAHMVTGRPRTLFEWPRRLSQLLGKLRPDVLHFHGTQLHVSLAALRRALPAASALVVHYHGGSPTRRRSARWLQRRNLRSARAVLFTTPGQASLFNAAGMLQSPDRAAMLIETSSDFRWMDRRTARSITGMHGRPVYLSAGRLHPVKDPLTTLRGFERIAETQREAQLYLYYVSDEMLPIMRAYVDARPMLRHAVHFRGRLPRVEMEVVFNSADIFLQASRREFSGCALLDAMACGVVPVVSELSSFRVIADQYGEYFPVGDAEALARRALDVGLDAVPARSEAVRGHFERELSFGAMAQKLEATYEKISEASS